MAARFDHDAFEQSYDGSPKVTSSAQEPPASDGQHGRGAQESRYGRGRTPNSSASAAGKRSPAKPRAGGGDRQRRRAAAGRGTEDAPTGATTVTSSVSRQAAIAARGERELTVRLPLEALHRLAEAQLAEHDRTGKRVPREALIAVALLALPTEDSQVLEMARKVKPLTKSAEWTKVTMTLPEVAVRRAERLSLVSALPGSGGGKVTVTQILLAALVERLPSKRTRRR